MLPSVFVSHGSPMIALQKDGDFARALGAFGEKHRPRAVLVVSAHWQTNELAVTADPRLIYDFGGFPDELYRIEYPCRGDEALAREVARGTGALFEDRGLDHGAWVPLRFLYPRAEVPVVQLSLPRWPREQLMALGETLRTFDDVLVVASGGIVHNLRLLHWDDEFAAVDPWAREFDSWVWEHFGRDLDASKAPHFSKAVPTREHFDPLYTVLGDEKELIYEGFRHGNLSMRSFATRVASR